MSPALVETAPPDPAAPVDGGSGKINPKSAQATNGQTASPIPNVNHDSYVASVASIGEIDGDSCYVELYESSPTIPANTPDLEGHISELE